MANPTAERDCFSRVSQSSPNLGAKARPSSCDSTFSSFNPPFGPSLTGIFHPSVRHTSCLPLLAALAISTMASLKLIDGQFDRAVEIVQGLPKNGPIQTDYEEKLTMYRQVVFFAFEKVEGSCYPDLLQSLQTRCLKSTAWLQTIA